MPTITNPASVGAHRAYSPGFKDQTHHDPFLPSAQNEEQLTEVRSDYNSDYRSSSSVLGTENYTAGGSTLNSHAGHAIGLMNPYSDHQSQVHLADQPSYDISTYTNDTPQSYNGTSPSNGYSSELEYTTMAHYVTQNFEHDFLLETDFGPLPIPEGLPLEFEVQPEEPISATSLRSTELSYASRRSTGLATLESQLMSPSLTATASPGSGNEMPTPPLKHRLLGGGEMSRLSSQSTGIGGTMSGRELDYTSHTPALTGTSQEATPEPTSGGGLSRHVSPIVRIESYSRGDSPRRGTNTIERCGSKRSRGSRSSSHLAAPRNGASHSSEESDDETYGGHRRNLDGQRHSETATETRIGLDPTSRSLMAHQTVPNFKDQKEEEEHKANKEAVTQWLATSETGVQTVINTDLPVGTRKYQSSNHRRRARSTSNQRDIEQYANSLDHSHYAELSAHIPGPNVLVDEDSGDDGEEDEDENDDESPTASIHGHNRHIEQPEDDHPRSNIDMRPQDAHPWIDPFHVQSQEGTPGQPATSNAAMMRFIKRSADLETASRVATWGTTTYRRLSEADIEKFVGREGLFARLSISKNKGKDDRRGSFLEQFEQAANKLLPKRTLSHMKRKTSEPTKLYSPTPVEDPGRKDSTHGRKESLHGRKESLGNRAGSPSVSTSVRRIPSLNKNKKSPKINTGSAIATFATHVAALGANGSPSPPPGSPTRQWSTRSIIKRTIGSNHHRLSTSEAPDSGLVDLWNKQGGPPVPTFASPPTEREAAGPFGPPTTGEDDDDADDITDDKGVTMDFTPRNVLIVPTFEGFKINVREINPRLTSYLVERIGQEQLRRYKKLVEFKVKHAQACQTNTCASGSQCTVRGGEPKYFPAKPNSKEPRHSHTGFSKVVEDEMDEDDEAVAEGIVTAAQFPPGVPLPPAKRLPAEFECPLCFTIKKFQKPSDWSKHVHEDLQPFTCTFQTCPDPKSFKRKADWVRHENERHRQLEWWTCTEDGCQHQCYRRDNFVQHLVREHKMPEPKAKNTKPNKPAVRGPAKTKARHRETENGVLPEDRVLSMIETCRHETAKSPLDEPCRFCGNTCNSWKKLTVHLAKHMEQISMPVLDLVRNKDVSPDTIISPIENKLTSQNNMSPTDQINFTQGPNANILPYHSLSGGQRLNQELQGSFTSLSNSTFPSNYENQVTGTFPWGQQNTNGPQIDQQLTPVNFNGMNGNTYSPNNIYQGMHIPQYIPTNSQARYVQPVSGAGEDPNFLGGLEQASQISQNNFPTSHPFGMVLERQPPYSNQTMNTQYMVPNPAHPQMQQLPMNAPVNGEFDPAGAIAFSQAPDTTYYHHNQQQRQYY